VEFDGTFCSVRGEIGAVAQAEVAYVSSTSSDGC
jgi:hypothetical protein